RPEAAPRVRGGDSVKVVLGKALDAIGRGELDLEEIDMVFVLVDDGHTFDDEVEFLDEIPSGDRVGDPAPVAGTRTMSNGVLSSDETEHVVENVPMGVTVRGLYLVHDSGTDETSRVIAFTDEKGDT